MKITQDFSELKKSIKEEVEKAVRSGVVGGIESATLRELNAKINLKKIKIDSDELKRLIQNEMERALNLANKDLKIGNIDFSDFIFLDDKALKNKITKITEQIDALDDYVTDKNGKTQYAREMPMLLRKLFAMQSVVDNNRNNFQESFSTLRNFFKGSGLTLKDAGLSGTQINEFNSVLGKANMMLISTIHNIVQNGETLVKETENIINNEIDAFNNLVKNSGKNFNQSDIEKFLTEIKIKSKDAAQAYKELLEIQSKQPKKTVGVKRNLGSLFNGTNDSLYETKRDTTSTHDEVTRIKYQIEDYIKKSISLSTFGKGQEEIASDETLRKLATAINNGIISISKFEDQKEAYRINDLLTKGASVEEVISMINGTSTHNKKEVDVDILKKAIDKVSEIKNLFSKLNDKTSSDITDDEKLEYLDKLRESLSSLTSEEWENLGLEKLLSGTRDYVDEVNKITKAIEELVDSQSKIRHDYSEDYGGELKNAIGETREDSQYLADTGREQLLLDEYSDKVEKVISDLELLSVKFDEIKVAAKADVIPNKKEEAETTEKATQSQEEYNEAKKEEPANSVSKENAEAKKQEAAATEAAAKAQEKYNEAKKEEPQTNQNGLLSGVENEIIDDANAILDTKSKLASKEEEILNLEKEQARLELEKKEATKGISPSENMSEYIQISGEYLQRINQIKDSIELAKIELQHLRADYIQEQLESVNNETEVWFRRVHDIKEILQDTGAFWAKDLRVSETYFNPDSNTDKLITANIDTSKLLEVDAEGNRWNDLSTICDELNQKAKELGITLNNLEDEERNVFYGNTKWIADAAKQLGYLGVKIKNVKDVGGFGDDYDLTGDIIQVFDNSFISDIQDVTNAYRGLGDEFERIQDASQVVFNAPKSIPYDLDGIEMYTKAEQEVWSKMYDIQNLRSELNNWEISNNLKEEFEPLLAQLRLGEISLDSFEKKYNEIFDKYNDALESLTFDDKISILEERLAKADKQYKRGLLSANDIEPIEQELETLKQEKQNKMNYILEEYRNYSKSLYEGNLFGEALFSMKALEDEAQNFGKDFVNQLKEINIEAQKLSQSNKNDTSSSSTQSQTEETEKLEEQAKEAADTVVKAEEKKQEAIEETTSAIEKQGNTTKKIRKGIIMADPIGQSQGNMQRTLSYSTDAVNELNEAEGNPAGTNALINNNINAIDSYEKLANIILEIISLQGKLEQNKLSKMEYAQYKKPIKSLSDYGLLDYVDTPDESTNRQNAISQLKQIDELYRNISKAVKKNEAYNGKAYTGKDLTELQNHAYILMTKYLSNKGTSINTELANAHKDIKNLIGAASENVRQVNANNKAYQQEEERLSGVNAALNERIKLLKESVVVGLDSSTSKAVLEMLDTSSLLSDIEQIAVLLGVKIPENATEILGKFKDIVNTVKDWKELSTRSGMFGNMSTGDISAMSPHDKNRASDNKLGQIIKNGYNSYYQSKASSFASFDPNDINTAMTDFQRGIILQAVAGLNEISFLNVGELSKENGSELSQLIKKEINLLQRKNMVPITKTMVDSIFGGNFSDAFSNLIQDNLSKKISEDELNKIDFSKIKDSFGKLLNADSLASADKISEAFMYATENSNMNEIFGDSFNDVFKKISESVNENMSNIWNTIVANNLQLIIRQATKNVLANKGYNVDDIYKTMSIEDFQSSLTTGEFDTFISQVTESAKRSIPKINEELAIAQAKLDDVNEVISTSPTAIRKYNKKLEEYRKFTDDELKAKFVEKTNNKTDYSGERNPKSKDLYSKWGSLIALMSVLKERGGDLAKLANPNNFVDKKDTGNEIELYFRRLNNIINSFSENNINGLALFEELQASLSKQVYSLKQEREGFSKSDNPNERAQAELYKLIGSLEEKSTLKRDDIEALTSAINNLKKTSTKPFDIKEYTDNKRIIGESERILARQQKEQEERAKRSLREYKKKTNGENQSESSDKATSSIKEQTTATDALTRSNTELSTSIDEINAANSRISFVNLGEEKNKIDELAIYIKEQIPAAIALKNKAFREEEVIVENVVNNEKANLMRLSSTLEEIYLQLMAISKTNVKLNIGDIGISIDENISKSIEKLRTEILQLDVDNLAQLNNVLSNLETHSGIAQNIKEIAASIRSLQRALSKVNDSSILSNFIKNEINSLDEFSRGLLESMPGVTEAVSKIAQIPEDEIRRILVIHSPSETMKKLGFWTGDGLAVGILSSKDEIRKSIINSLKAGEVTPEEIRELIGWNGLDDLGKSMFKRNTKQGKSMFSNLKDVVGDSSIFNSDAIRTFEEKNGQLTFIQETIKTEEQLAEDIDKTNELLREQQELLNNTQQISGQMSLSDFNSSSDSNVLSSLEREIQARERNINAINEQADAERILRAAVQNNADIAPIPETPSEKIEHNTLEYLDRLNTKVDLSKLKLSELEEEWKRFRSVQNNSSYYSKDSTEEIWNRFENAYKQHGFVPDKWGEYWVPEGDPSANDESVITRAEQLAEAEKQVADAAEKASEKVEKVNNAAKDTTTPPSSSSTEETLIKAETQAEETKTKFDELRESIIAAIQAADGKDIRLISSSFKSFFGDKRADRNMFGEIFERLGYKIGGEQKVNQPGENGKRTMSFTQIFRPGNNDIIANADEIRKIFEEIISQGWNDAVESFNTNNLKRIRIEQQTLVGNVHSNPHYNFDSQESSKETENIQKSAEELKKENAQIEKKINAYRILIETYKKANDSLNSGKDLTQKENFVLEKYKELEPVLRRNIEEIQRTGKYEEEINKLISRRIELERNIKEKSNKNYEKFNTQNAKEYYEILKRIQQGVISDVDTSSIGNIEKLWEEAASGTGKFQEASKSVDTFANSIKALIQSDLSKLKGRKNLATDYIKSIEKEINNLNTTNFDTDNFDNYKQQILEILNNVEKLKQEVSSTSARSITNDEIAGKQLEIEKFLAKNSALTNEQKEAFKQLNNEYSMLYNSGKPHEELEKLNARFKQLQQEAYKAGNIGKNFFTLMSTKIKHLNAQFFSMYFSWMDWIRYIRNAFNAIKSLDTALIDLKKTTTMSNYELKEFYFSSNAIAKQMGVTTEEIINQASAFSRLGYSSKEASETMAELSSKFASISPDMDVSTATDGLVSIMKAFDVEVSDVERKILDNINVIGNTAATSNGEIVNMLTRSSAAMKEANNSLEETIALETAAVEITRDAESTGTAFKTISMRIRGKHSLPPYTVMYMLCV